VQSTSDLSPKHCLWKEILSQQRIRHFKVLQSIYFAHDVGIISSSPKHQTSETPLKASDMMFETSEVATLLSTTCSQKIIRKNGSYVQWQITI